jgi:hypothetical protein
MVVFQIVIDINETTKIGKVAADVFAREDAHEQEITLAKGLEDTYVEIIKTLYPNTQMTKVEDKGGHEKIKDGA